MRVLITGHRGFVGRHFARRFEEDGHWVVGLDVAQGRQFDCRRLFESNDGDFDLVVHCAAVVGGRATIDGNPLAVAENLAIDSDMARWAARTRPGRVVYFSSSAAYPLGHQQHDSRQRPLNEDLIFEQKPDYWGQVLPDQVYGWAKLTGEQLMARLGADGVPVHVLRPFSGYGADQDTTYPFPAFVLRALHRLDPFVVWGDGSQVRDFVHIDDVVATTLAVIEADCREPVNIGTGVGTSMLTLADMVCTEAGYRPALETRPDMPSGVPYRVADVTRMQDFHTAKVPLEQGIAEALR